MRSTFLLLALLTGIAGSAFAQTADTTSDPGFTASTSKATGVPTTVSPTERAARQLTILQKKLNLNQDQVVKLRMILLRLNIALDSLRSNPSGDKKSDNQARRAITQDSDGKIFSLLTTDQQVAYAKWKQELQLKRQLDRAARKDSTTPADTTSQHP